MIRKVWHKAKSCTCELHAFLGNLRTGKRSGLQITLPASVSPDMRRWHEDSQCDNCSRQTDGEDSGAVFRGAWLLNSHRLPCCAQILMHLPYVRRASRKPTQRQYDSRRTQQQQRLPMAANSSRSNSHLLVRQSTSVALLSRRVPLPSILLAACMLPSRWMARLVQAHARGRTRLGSRRCRGCK